MEKPLIIIHHTIKSLNNSVIHTPMQNIFEKARAYGIKCHRDTNHTYGDKPFEYPYEYHLNMVFEYAVKFIHIIPEEDRLSVLASCYVHDCIEDCRVTFRDLVKVTNETIANIAYALTNEKGRNREERANDRYYDGIKATKYASFVKICDRLANIKHGVDTNSSMVTKYEKEQEKFSNYLKNYLYTEMFAEADRLFDLYESKNKK